MLPKELQQKLLLIRNLIDECLTVDGMPKGVKEGRPLREQETQSKPAGKIDYSKNLKAFVKTYSKNMSGPQKFVLILAYITKGEINKDVKVDLVKKNWSKMMSILKGEFNAAYSTRALENDWVEPNGQGVYRLKSSWRQIFK